MSDLLEFLAADDPLVATVKTALRRRRSYRVEALADELDVSPRRIRQAVDTLRRAGFRVPKEADGTIELVKVPPDDHDTITKLPLALLNGELARFGVVSDTHLGSKYAALSELHLAYDYFAREEITTVLHPGDLVDGVGVYKGQHNYLTHHTFEDQRDHAIEDYPRRDGIITHMIGGNHDLEGDFGKVGADPVRGVSNQRPDIHYLGEFSQWLELPNGAHIHLLHGRGGMSYSFSYKMQKLCEAYPAGRKPAALILGHFHVQCGGLECRGIQGMFPACFQWISKQFGERAGHRNSVGFHTVEIRLGDDGSLVEWAPRWHPIWEGRVLNA